MCYKEFIPDPLGMGEAMNLHVIAEDMNKNHGESGFGPSNSFNSCRDMAHQEVCQGLWYIDVEGG